MPKKKKKGLWDRDSQPQNQWNHNHKPNKKEHNHKSQPYHTIIWGDKKFS